MLGWKTIFAFISALTYAILLILFYNFIKSENYDEGECNEIKPCIRFCAEDRSKNEKLLEKFKSYEIINPSVKVFNGEPECVDKTVDNPLAQRYEYETVILKFIT